MGQRIDGLLPVETKCVAVDYTVKASAYQLDMRPLKTRLQDVAGTCEFGVAKGTPSEEIERRAREHVESGTKFRCYVCEGCNKKARIDCDAAQTTVGLMLFLMMVLCVVFFVFATFTCMIAESIYNMI